MADMSCPAWGSAETEPAAIESCEVNKPATRTGMAFKFLFIRIIPPPGLHETFPFPCDRANGSDTPSGQAHLLSLCNCVLYQGNIYCVFTNHEITIFIFQIAPHTMQVNGVSHHGIVDQRDPEPLTVFQQHRCGI